MEGKCRAHVCEAMKIYEIDPDRCKGAVQKCARNCPVGAITGEKRKNRIRSRSDKVYQVRNLYGKLYF